MTDKERFLDTIIRELSDFEQVSVKNKNWIKNSYWKKAICQITDFDLFAKKITETIKKHIKNVKRVTPKPDKEKLKGKDYIKIRQEITLTQNEYIKGSLAIDSNECFIERLMTYAANRNLNEPFALYWNQYNTGIYNKREAIDIRIKVNDKYDLVELKALSDKKTADNPLFAIIECVKNYYLYSNPEKINKLVVLAPIDYWEKLLNHECYQKLKKLIKSIEKIDKKVKIDLKFIDCSTGILGGFTEIFKNHVTSLDGFEKKGTKGKTPDMERKYTHAKKYNLEQIYSWLEKEYNFNELFEVHDLEALYKIQLIIHRGSHQIGGSCVEIKDDKTRILFDLGLPLDDNIKPQDAKLKIKGLYKDETPEIDGIFISHAHPDHYGMLRLINPEIPVYASQMTKTIINDISYLLPNNSQNKDLPIKVIAEKQIIGDFVVIPHEVNHSIGGAVSYEIKYKNKTVFYTGDLRLHGLDQEYLEEISKRIKSPDYMIMEGTTISRGNQNSKTEKEICEILTEKFKNDNMNILVFSPLNIDRFKMIYSACVNAGKQLIIDPYTLKVLDFYRFDIDLGKTVRVLIDNNSITKRLKKDDEFLDRCVKNGVKIKYMLSQPDKYIVKFNYYVEEKLIKELPKEKIRIIYSLWSGYRKQKGHLKEYEEIIEDVHTSGHADIASLQKLVKVLSPKTIIPIHTEQPQKYVEYFGKKVKILKDDEILSL